MAIATLATPFVHGFPATNDTQQLANFRRCDHVIQIWLGGGMSQMDTFDPKPLGDPKAKRPGSLYPTIPTAVDGVEVCEYLPRLAERMERITAIRSLTHSVIDEHAAATNFMHTGRSVNSTAAYPSIGSIIAAESPRLSDEAPPYVLIGYPSQSRGPGFLGGRGAFVYLTDTNRGPRGLMAPPTVDAVRRRQRIEFLKRIRDAKQPSLVDDATLANYDETIERSLKIASGEFGQAFDLDQEPETLRSEYGSEFGQRLLLTRRLLQRGVRFVEVGHNLNFINGTGWDVHNEGILNQHELIEDLDRSIAKLMDDLQSIGKLDSTLILISSEFGRPLGFDGGGGRGHQGSVFTCVLLGGGLNHCGAYGASDEQCKQPADRPVTAPDLFATVLAAVGIEPNRKLFDGDRPVPVTDGGNPIADLFS